MLFPTLRVRLANALLPYFKPARSRWVPGVGRYLLLHPLGFELWFRGRAAVLLARRRWSVATGDIGSPSWDADHRRRVVEHNFRNRWRFSRERTEKLMNILRCVGGVSRESRVLCIGPRNEAELLLLSLYGFDLNKIVGIDLQTYSPLIRQMDMHKLDFEDDSFDIVYVLYTLVYAYDLDRACAEIVRVLKDGGLVAAGFQQTPRATDLRAKGAELRGGLAELFEKFDPYIAHVYWQEAEPVSWSEGDNLVTTIFRITKGRDAAKEGAPVNRG